MKMIPIYRAAEEARDKLQIKREFIEFAAQRCECFNPNDKETILSVIRKGLGGIPGFDEAVRQIFVGTSLWAELGLGEESSGQDTDSSSDDPRQIRRSACMAKYRTAR